MPQIKIDLPQEVLNEWARLANERKEPVRVTLSNFVSQEARKLTKRAADFLPCGHLSSEYKELAPLSFGCASCAAKSG